MRNHLPPHKIGLVGVAACVAVGSAWAAATSSLHVSAPNSVKSGQSFKVKLSGSAAGSSHLYAYLDRSKCSKRWDREASRDTYKSGHSYFLTAGEGGKIKTSYTFAVVSGKFKTKAVAYAGAKTGAERVCAYLVGKDRFGNFSVTSAKARTSYKVA